MPKSTRRRFVAQSGTVLAARNTLLAVPAAAAAQAPPQRRLLSSRFPLEKVASALVPRNQWHPFPTASDRTGWQSIPPDVRTALLADGEEHLGTGWPALPATLFLEFARNGNRSNYEGVRNRRRGNLRKLVIAECVHGDGRFLDDIVNGLWTTCEETWWGVPAHMGMQKAGRGLPDVNEPVVDLFAAETASLVAWTEYLLGPQLEKISPLLRERIYSEVDRRILKPNFDRIDFWWMGLDPKLSRSVNNWNPWINSNWLTSVLLLERDEARRGRAVHKILLSLDRFLDSYHEDGGCDEGPGYWFRAGASLFDCLDLLDSASRGAINVYDQPLIREIGRYIYRAHIFDNYFLNFADAPAKVNIAGDLVYRYGKRIEDEKMQGLGAFGASKQGVAVVRSDSIGRQLPAIFNVVNLRSAAPRQPLVRDVWLPGIEVMTARVSDGSERGLYLAAKGGHNAESHNHNDVGNFVVYADGQPVIIDVGVETYTAKTFSANRYEIWTMQSAYHNLPTIAGVMQPPGRNFAARGVRYRAGDDSVEFSLDIARAYPADAGLETWVRTLRLNRARGEVEIEERYALRKPANDIALTLMTPCTVAQGASGELMFTGPGLRSPVTIQYDASILTPKTEEIAIEDSRLRSAWGERLFRVLLVSSKPPRKAEWRLRVSQR